MFNRRVRDDDDDDDDDMVAGLFVPTIILLVVVVVLDDGGGTTNAFVVVVLVGSIIDTKGNKNTTDFNANDDDIFCSSMTSSQLKLRRLSNDGYD